MSWTVIAWNESGPKNATSPRSTSIGACVISFQRSPFQYSHSSMRARSRPPRSGQPMNTRSTAESPMFPKRGSDRYMKRSTRCAPPNTSNEPSAAWLT